MATRLSRHANFHIETYNIHKQDTYASSRLYAIYTFPLPLHEDIISILFVSNDPNMYPNLVIKIGGNVIKTRCFDRCRQVLAYPYLPTQSILYNEVEVLAKEPIDGDLVVTYATRMPMEEDNEKGEHYVISNDGASMLVWRDGFCIQTPASNPNFDVASSSSKEDIKKYIGSKYAITTSTDDRIAASEIHKIITNAFPSFKGYAGDVLTELGIQKRRYANGNFYFGMRLLDGDGQSTAQPSIADRMASLEEDRIKHALVQKQVEVLHSSLIGVLGFLLKQHRSVDINELIMFISDRYPTID